jgi:hypothetical protein
MIRLQPFKLTTIDDALDMLQTAIAVEFGTLPPYLYAMFSIPPGENVPAATLIKSVLMQEMVHMCLAANILNALGGDAKLVPPVYPGPLPGDIGNLQIHLLPFSKEAMQQGMDIEEPYPPPPDFPVETTESVTYGAAEAGMTIGQFYGKLDRFLATVDPNAWQGGRNQIDDNQYFAGQLFPVNNYADAHRAISIIVSEGEGAGGDPLDFEDELAHYYRFRECRDDLVLTKSPEPPGWQWGPTRLGVDFSKVYPAIADPSEYDFSKATPAARAAQAACDSAYTAMVGALQQALTGADGALGQAVRAMFDLRMAAKAALHTPLTDDGDAVSGPAFLTLSPGASS